MKQFPIFTICAIVLVSTVAVSQQITIRVIDARKARPLSDEVVDVWFGEHAMGSAMKVKTGKDGSAVVSIPKGETRFVIAGEWIADCRGATAPERAL